VLFDKRNKCLKFVINSYLNKHEFPIFLGVNKALSKSAITQLKQVFKVEYSSIEEKIKQLKEVL
jgi:hypothetical protein